jgi:hypothetical protein
MQAAWLSKVTLVTAQSCLCGAIMQASKLASIDSAGRQFGLTQESSKMSFLAAYGLTKASANLLLGWLVRMQSDVKWGGVAGAHTLSLSPPTLRCTDAVLHAQHGIGVLQDTALP